MMNMNSGWFCISDFRNSFKTLEATHRYLQIVNITPEMRWRKYCKELLDVKHIYQLNEAILDKAIFASRPGRCMLHMTYYITKGNDISV